MKEPFLPQVEPSTTANVSFSLCLSKIFAGRHNMFAFQFS